MLAIGQINTQYCEMNIVVKTNIEMIPNYTNISRGKLKSIICAIYFVNRQILYSGR